MSTAAPHHAAPRRMSLDEWASLPEDVPGELVDGELVEEEVPDYDHEGVVAWLVGNLWQWIDPRGGWVFGSEGKVALRTGLGRKPDASVFFPGRPVPRHGPARTPPDIAIEVISSDPRDVRRDRVDKAKDYAAFGVHFYWLIDPDTETFEIFELTGGGSYEQVLCMSKGTIDPPGCEGLRLNLDALWAKLAKLV